MDRLTRAIDQLGHARLDVRLGGIYALERIARDSPADSATIMEVLTAFVRRRAPWPPRPPGQYVATAPIDQVPELQVRAADVQACLAVLGRGGFAPAAEGQGDRLDLHAVDLRRADLRDARLEGADLRRARLERADLRGGCLERASLRRARLEEADLGDAHLEWADLGDADLEGADLSGAALQGAYLFDADLEEANLGDAHLEEANLWNADLEGADLSGAVLEEAILIGAHLERAALPSAVLEGAELSGAVLEGALADERTAWPEEFDWRAAGIIVSGEATAASRP